MNEPQRALSDSEIQKLREDLAETERRKWLLRLARTAAAWIGGLLTFLAAMVSAVATVADWLTKK